MAEFQITLAGRVIGIRSLYEQVYSLCRDYLTSGREEDFRVETTPADLVFEHERSLREAALEGRRQQRYSEAYLETLAVYRRIAVRMPDYNTWLMHGSAVAAGDSAFLFTAASGIGKTTHTRLWLQTIPGSYVINGDKPLLQLRNGRCTVWGTPWSGKERMNRNAGVPLRGICILERGKENRIEELSFMDAVPLLLQQSYRPAEPAAMQKTLQLVYGLKDSVRFYRLQCNMDPSAALVAYQGMTGRI